MEKQKNMPQLRFPEFEGEWENLKLGELSKSIHSGKDSNVFDGNYPLYGSMGIIGKSSSPTYEGKYILVARVGANAGSINLVEDSFGVTDNTLVIENDSRIDTDFEYYLLKVANLNRYIFGSGQPLVTGSMLKALKVLIPSLPEQLKIASFFTAIDQKILQLKRKKTLLEEYKKGVMQKIFSQGIRFKDDNGQEFPKWEKKRLGNILNERNIQVPKSDEYPLMAFVANKGVAHKGERYNREFLVNDGDNKKYKQTEYGDFIYSSNNLETGSIGLNSFGSASISPVYSIFQIDESCNPQFLGCYFVRKSFINKMTSYRQGVVYGQWRIHESDFLKIEEWIPSTTEQTKIANFLSAIDDKINHTQKQVEKAEVWKKGLMQQMFC